MRAAGFWTGCLLLLGWIGVIRWMNAPSIHADDKKTEVKKEEKKDEVKKEEKKEEPAKEEPLDPVKDAEKMLAEAKLRTEPKDLLDYIRTRTLNSTQRELLNKSLQQLGDDDFDIRQQAMEQFLKTGLVSAPILRTAIRDKQVDPEVSRRVSHCLDKINAGNEFNNIVASATLLAKNKVDGTAEVLIPFIACIPDDEYLQDLLTQSLISYTKNRAKADPYLIDSLTAKDNYQRALAAQILAEVVPDQRPAVKKLIDDPDSRVRYMAAFTLAKHGDKSVLPALIGLLEEDPQEYAYLVEDFLLRLLGSDERPPATLTTMEAEQRKKVRTAWNDWWSKNEAKIDLTKIHSEEAYRGFTVIAEVDGVGGGRGGHNGRVWECGPDGKQRWEWTNVHGPVDIQVLSGNRFLIAEYYNSRVTERDKEGKILWQSPALNGNTVAAIRLPNGNTLTATMQEVVEYKKDGTRVGNPYPRPGGPVYHIRRDKKGHTYILAGNEIVELDGDRKEVRKTTVGQISGWAGFDILPNGNYLVCYYTLNRKYVEIDPKGKILFENTTSVSPSRVQRLRGDHVLCAGGDTNSVVEYNRNKTEVWKVPTKGRPFSAIRY